MSRAHFRARVARAFTLIELLVVIAIIGILAAIVVPVTARVRTSAQQAQSAGNLRQVGVALASYAQEHRGAFPQTTHGASGDLTGLSWIFTLRPYLGNVDDVRLCPLDPRREERRAARLSSYVLNDQLDPKTYFDPFGRPTGVAPSLFTLRAPSRLMTVMTGADDLPLNVSADHIHSRQWGTTWAPVWADIAPDRFRSGAAGADHTNGSSPYLFADGHVVVIPASTLRTRIEAGDNPTAIQR